MLLHIHDESTLADIQEKFNECFPFLKIEFYGRPHHRKAGRTEKEILSSLKKVGEVSRTHREMPLEIMSTHTVAHVENDFKKLYGLEIQLFRKSNSDWVPTANTETLTLRQQEAISENERETSLPEMQEPQDDYDYL